MSHIYTTKLIPTELVSDGALSYLEVLDAPLEVCEAFAKDSGLEIHEEWEQCGNASDASVARHYLYPIGKSIQGERGLNSAGWVVKNGEKSTLVTNSLFNAGRIK